MANYGHTRITATGPQPDRAALLAHVQATAGDGLDFTLSGLFAPNVASDDLMRWAELTATEDTVVLSVGIWWDLDALRPRAPARQPLPRPPDRRRVRGRAGPLRLRCPGLRRRQARLRRAVHRRVQLRGARQGSPPRRVLRAHPRPQPGSARASQPGGDGRSCDAASCRRRVAPVGGGRPGMRHLLPARHRGHRRPRPGPARRRPHPAARPRPLRRLRTRRAARSRNRQGTPARTRRNAKRLRLGPPPSSGTARSTPPTL